jgi:polyisoprenoid-binding protein YceI
MIMKTKLFILTLLMFSHFAIAQKYISKNGHIWFYSHTPIEDIVAHNRQVVSILDASTGTIQFSLLIKSFEFKIALMQEHFNENYMESDKFPKASFKGTVKDIEKINFNKDADYHVEVSGDLFIHGVTDQVTTKGIITVQGSSATAKAKFIVAPKDYDIKIPSVVENNIAKEIEVNVDVTYNQR